MAKEAQARIKINELLTTSGWRLLDDPEKGKANVSLESNVKIQGNPGDDFEHVETRNGFVDYLMYDSNNFPICVLEAKSEDKHPLDGKEQARDYANSLGSNVRYIILSNGNLHYLWDLELGNPTRLSHFPTLESLISSKDFIPDKNRLLNTQVEDDYIALTQDPDYRIDPRWSTEEGKKEMIEKEGLRFLRPYQLRAVQAVQNAVAEGKNRFLLEMATGTGKTLVSAGIIRLFLKTKNARRVLFLVDRLELENQAKKSFDAYLKPDFTTVVYKEARDDWRKAEIVVSTIQSFAANNKYLKLFSPNDFDLIISDEAHRSISGSSRVIFEYFIGYKLGLTATPKDYLKKVDQEELSEQDPRELERRILLSTYKTFGCDAGEPTFRYSLIDGVKDGFLVNPKTIDCRTEITTQLLSDEGYVMEQDPDSEEGEYSVTDEEGNQIVYTARDFEKKFFSEETNRKFVEAFMQNAQRDPISGEIGKSIIFCVSQKHAAKIANILNEYAMQMYPEKYQSDFALQITSNVRDAQQYSIQFANNNLRGLTKFLDGYKSSRARVCVTVGMMTTGYDCQDLLNVALLRPIFSPTDFVQIKGRGTRRFKFRYSQRDGNIVNEIVKDKEYFKLFDFFANCEYFEKEYPYDEILALPKQGERVTAGPGGDGPFEPPVRPDPEGIYRGTDVITEFNEVEIDENGMRIDRELYSNQFEEKLKEVYTEDPEFKEAVDSSDYETAQQVVTSQVFDKPEEYYNMDRLRKSYKIDRRIFLEDIFEKVFKGKSFKTKNDLAEDDFQNYLVVNDVSAEDYYNIKEFFKLYVADETFRRDINAHEITRYADDPILYNVISNLGMENIETVTEYVKDNVQINKYYNQ
jgi:type I restriction enzyme R subunit